MNALPARDVQWHMRLAGKMVSWRFQARARKRPSLKGLQNFADYLPLEMRKTVKAMVGDFDAEIMRLHKQHRYGAARWNKGLAWSYAVWYMARGPLDWVISKFVKAHTGG